ANKHERGVAGVPLPAQLLAVAVAAVDAHRLERHLLGHLRAEQLRHSCPHVGALAGVLLRRRRPRPEPRRPPAASPPAPARPRTPAPWFVSPCSRASRSPGLPSSPPSSPSPR